MTKSRPVRHSKQQLIEQLIKAGVNKGDVIYVRADFMQLGRIEGGPKTVVEALLEAIGPEGTLVGVAFTKTYFLPFLKKHHIYTQDSPSITGGLSKLLLAHPGAKRSHHPSQSFVAIGKHADAILDGHDASQGCFQLVEKLIDYRAKMLLLGCHDTSPGFSTVHYAQLNLGLSHKSIFSGLRGIYYKTDDNRLALYKKKDIPGCSLGQNKFYKPYSKAGILQVEPFADSFVYVVPAKEAYELEYELLSTDPCFTLCDNPTCFSCRASLTYNKRDMIRFIFRDLGPMLCRFVLKKIKR